MIDPRFSRLRRESGTRNMSNIAIDGFRLVAERHSSGAGVCREIIESLAAEPEVGELVLLAPRAPAADLRLPEKVRVVCPRRPHFPERGFARQTYWIQITLPRLVRGLAPQPDLLIMPYHHTPLRTLGGGCRICTIIHDLCGLDRALYGRATRGHYEHRFMLWSAARAAHHLVPGSHFTAQELGRRFPQCRDRIRGVAWYGVASRHMELAQAQALLAPLRLEPGSYFLAFASPGLRKGFDRALDAYGCYIREGGGKRLALLPHTLCDAPGEAVRRSVPLSQISVLDKVDDARRDALYAGAVALLFFSRCEGFGLPVVEAMRQGCPPLFACGGSAEILGGEHDWLEIAPWSAPAAALAMHAAEQLRPQERGALARSLQSRSTLFDRASNARRLRQVLLPCAGSGR